MLPRLLLQDIPDTTSGLVFGYIAIGVIFGLYLLSLFLRARSYRRDLDIIEQTEQDND
ncbi:MAG: hypothetical protein ACFB51_03370 [Anaerolineae bacterium]